MSANPKFLAATAQVDEAANEIDGLIDPVIERGPIYVPVD